MGAWGAGQLAVLGLGLCIKRGSNQAWLTLATPGSENWCPLARVTPVLHPHAHVGQAHGRAASCLVTGNLEPIGWAKMRALGIEPLFTRPLFGGFGTDHCR